VAVTSVRGRAPSARGAAARQSRDTRSSHMNSIRRTPECAEDHIELGLELRDSGELDAQLPLGIAKPLAYGPARFGRGATSTRAGRGGR